MYHVGAILFTVFAVKQIKSLNQLGHSSPQQNKMQWVTYLHCVHSFREQRETIRYEPQRSLSEHQRSRGCLSQS